MTVFDGLGAEVVDLFTDRATVYAQATVAPRAYSVAVKSGLVCLLTEVTQARETAQTGGARAELSGIRELFWLGAYAMPKNVRLQINGGAERWIVSDQTVTPVPAGANPPEVWHADVQVQRQT